MSKRSITQGFWILFTYHLLVLLCASAAFGQNGGQGPVQGSLSLGDKVAILDAILNSPFEEPLHISSSKDGDGMQGEIHAILDYPLPALQEQLQQASAWCEILFLHLNVKACLPRAGQGSEELIIFTGRKYFQEPGDAERITLRFAVEQISNETLEGGLTSANGPYGTRDFFMRVQAVPLDAKSSLIRFQYRLGYGSVARLALQIYFATLGRNKKGFTCLRDCLGDDPVLVGGVRGMIERNTMRFYYGLLAYLEHPAPEMIQARLKRWFELTERHPKQLREIDRETYLEQKRKERQEQELLRADDTD